VVGGSVAAGTDGTPPGVLVVHTVLYTVSQT